MSIWLTGDFHSTIDIQKITAKHFKEGKLLKKEDVLIELGDFGFVWGKTFSETDKHWLNYLKNRPWTTVFVVGNHENYTRLNSDEFPIVPMFGDEVKKIWDDVYMLQTGHIYTIDNKKVFAFGGGMSIDKEQRTPNISWWEEEIPTSEQFNLAVSNLAKVNNEVDLIAAHATHENFYSKLFRGFAYKYNDPLHRMLENIRNNVSYKVFASGHYHVDLFDKETKSICLYDKVKSYNEVLKMFE